jgi:hypothetical protein
MKQLLSLFLFLLPCLAWAQYPSNGNQKITLGEQTTADGLIFRGIAADTTTTVKSDTAAYFVLDTVNINLYTYKASATGRKWRQLGADTAAIAYVNTYGTQTVNGAKTFTSAVTGARFNPTSSSASGDGMYLPTTNNIGFTTSGIERMRVQSDGTIRINSGGATSSATFQLFSSSTASEGGGLSVSYLGGGSYGPLKFVTGGSETMRISGGGLVGIGTDNPAVQFHTTGGVRFATFAGGGTTTLSVDNNGDLARTSSIELKNNITNIKYGLSDILKINPINFNWKDENKFGNENENGFIAEDVYTIIPNVVSSDNNGIFMDYTKLIPILTKAIQEQNSLIKALEQRIINLENK